MTNNVLDLLEHHFNTAFAAPDGIKKLRELILTLAMQGKLVPQDPEDQPASELLKEIEVEKQRLVKEGRVKKPKVLPEIKVGEVPYELPERWEWTTVQQLGFVLGGKRLPKGHTYSEIPTSHRYLTVTNMKNGTIVDNNIKYIEQKTHAEIKKYVISKNDLYITIAGTIGVVGIIPDHCDGMNLTENASRFIFLKCKKTFLVYLLNSGVVQEQFAALTNKMAQPKLSLRSILSTGIPLPPLAEQHRIVTKVDQLMARCDELEKLRAEHEQKRLSLHTAAIKQLLDAELHTNAWQFITQHFGELYSVKENVTELRKAILQLAVMGRLVPQDPGDPPASELLKEIKAEKQRLIKEKRIKKPKLLPEIKSENMPYVLPEGWEWTRLENVVEISSGVTKGRKLTGKTLVTLPYLRVANVQRAYLNLDVIKDIEIAEDEIEKFALKERDLLITEGGDWDKVGRTAIWHAEIDMCIHQNHIFKARCLLYTQNEYWLEKYLNSVVARTYFAGASKQTTNLASINKTQLRGCPIPVPSLPEQHRIVTKIDQLMALCDTLESQIDATTGKQTKLLNAMMAQV